jgi:hypothetical protein
MVHLSPPTFQEPDMADESARHGKQRTIQVVTKVEQDLTNNYVLVERSSLIFDEEGRLVDVQQDGTTEIRLGAPKND